MYKQALLTFIQNSEVKRTKLKVKNEQEVFKIASKMKGKYNLFIEDKMDEVPYFRQIGVVERY